MEFSSWDELAGSSNEGKVVLGSVKELISEEVDGGEDL